MDNADRVLRDGESRGQRGQQQGSSKLEWRSALAGRKDNGGEFVERDGYCDDSAAVQKAIGRVSVQPDKQGAHWIYQLPIAEEVSGGGGAAFVDARSDGRAEASGPQPQRGGGRARVRLLLQATRGVLIDNIEPIYL